MKKITLFFIFLTGLTFAAYAQDSNWINYTNGDDIRALAFEGNTIWAGTTGGLVSHNNTTGDQVFFNKANSGLPANRVTSIAIDQSGTKWMGTYFEGGYLPFGYGLAAFDGNNWTVHNIPDSIGVTGHNLNIINTITIDGNGSLWIGGYSNIDYGSGLVAYDGINWTVYNTSNSGLPSDFVHTISIDQNGTKWIGTINGGLAVFDGSSWIVHNTSNSNLPGNWVKSIAIDQSGTKWIATENGLAAFDGSNWTVYNTSNSGLPSNGITEIAIDQTGTKWIGTEDGLVVFDGINWTIYHTSNSELPSNHVQVIVIDDSGTKWIGTEDGLVAFDSINSAVINTSNSGLPDNNVGPLEIDGSNIWIGSGGLTMFDGSNWMVYNTSNSGLPDNSVESIAIGQSGTKWIGTSNGLAAFDGNNWSVYNTSNSGIPSNGIRALAVDGSNIWIGTRNGLAAFDGNNWSVYNTSNSPLPYNWVSKIVIDGNGTKWIGLAYGIGNDGGLVAFDGSNWTVYNTTNSGLPGNRISSLAIEEDGTMWIGSQGYWGYQSNLVAFDGNTWMAYNTSNSGLPEDNIVSLAIDGNGTKWMGPFYLGYMSGIDIGAGLVAFDGTNWTVHNTSNSGLPDNKVGSIAVDGNGTKWIGTWRDGLAAFNENGVISNNCLPEGITFTTQTQIDSFQVLYPNCTEIEGDVRIGGEDITNLNGLDVLTTIMGNLWIEDNYLLTNLTGLDSLKTIGGDLGIMDNVLKSLTGLDGLTQITGYLFISGNDSLTSLTGLNNINNSSITDLTITYNNSLSTCEVQSVCDYLVSPNGEVEIHDNAPGCNSQEEVEEACASSVNEMSALFGIKTQPNPFSTSTTLSYELQQPEKVSLSIYNQMGQLVYQTQENQPQGKQSLMWNADGYADGVYYYRLQVGNQITNGKMVKVR